MWKKYHDKKWRFLIYNTHTYLIYGYNLGNVYKKMTASYNIINVYIFPNFHIHFCAKRENFKNVPFAN